MDGGLGERILEYWGGVIPGPGMFSAGPEAIIIPHLSGALPEVGCR